MWGLVAICTALLTPPAQPAWVGGVVRRGEAGGGDDPTPHPRRAVRPHIIPLPKIPRGLSAEAEAGQVLAAWPLFIILGQEGLIEGEPCDL